MAQRKTRTSVKAEAEEAAAINDGLREDAARNSRRRKPAAVYRPIPQPAAADSA